MLLGLGIYSGLAGWFLLFVFFAVYLSKTGLIVMSLKSSVLSLVFCLVRISHGKRMKFVIMHFIICLLQPMDYIWSLDTSAIL